MAEAASPSSHLKAQTGPNDESATTHDLLECLQAHLSPQPAFSVLPAALHILAHFEVLATRVEAEVERALKYNDKLAMILDQGGHKASSSTGHGALVTARRDALEKLQKNVVEQNLRVKVFESSLEWRCIHMIVALSVVKPSAIIKLRNTYFPEISEAFPHSQQTSTMFFIRIMRPGQCETFQKRRKEVLGWFELAETHWRAHGNAPTVGMLDMNYDGTKIDILVENTLGLAHMVANQAQTLQDIFTKTKVPNAPTQKEDAVPLFLDQEEEPIALEFKDTGNERSSGVRAKPGIDVKKRPRASLSTGPDYTAPVSSMGSKVDKSKIRPFDSKKLYRPPPKRIKVSASRPA